MSKQKELHDIEANDTRWDWTCGSQKSHANQRKILWNVRAFESRVNSSGSQKAADSNVALRMNISALVRFSDSAKISKNVASLVD